MHHTDDHDSVLEALDSGANFFLTGSAGSGKTTLIARFVKETNRKAAVCATTGVAALQVGGETIHRFLKLGISCRPPEARKILAAWTRVRSSPKPWDRAKWKTIRTIETIVIDEASMMRRDQLELIDRTLRGLRSRRVPFGGVQIILVGDMCQLPPVVKDEDLEHFPDLERPFAFQSKVWQEAEIESFNLTTNFRQASGEFLTALEQIRWGVVSDEVNDMLAARVHAKLDTEIKPISLFTTNKSVEQYNKKHIARLKAYKFKCTATFTGKEFDVSILKKDCLADEALLYCEGAQIMMLNNDKEKRWVNGTMGIISKCLKDSVRVQFSNGTDHIIEKHKWERRVPEIVKDELEFKVTATMTQFPFKLAYASTIHKCVTGNAKVSTKAGLIPIQQISAKIEVLTGQNTVQPILAHIPTGKRPVVTITTSLGYAIAVSPEHPILVATKDKYPHFVNAQDLTTDYYACMDRTIVPGNARLPLPNLAPPTPPMRRRSIRQPKHPSPQLAWLLGLVVGDGTYRDRRDGTVEITGSQRDIELLTKAETLIEEIFGIRSHWRRGEKVGLYFISKALREWMLSLGLDYVLSVDKKTPPFIFQSTPKVRAAYLRGLADSDGSASRERRNVRFATSSKDLANEIQQLLLSLGIPSSKHQLITASGKRAGEPTWHIYLAGTSLELYRNRVGFELQRKQNTLNEACDTRKVKNKTEVDFIPFGRHIFEEIRKLVPPTEYPRKKNSGWGGGNKQLHGIISTLKQGAKLTYYHLETLLKRLEKLKIEAPSYMQETLDRNYFFTPITKISTSEDTAEMYDIEVKNDHSFVANGFVCHNSQGLTLDYAEMDLSSAFAPGQTYVALSRVRALEGLTLKGWNRKSVFTDPAILEFYEKSKTKPRKPKVDNGLWGFTD